MKKKSLLAILLVMFCLSGCVTIHDTIHFAEPKEISSIDIYRLESVELRKSGFQKDVTPIYTLDDSQKGDFLKELEEIDFTSTLILFPAAVDPSFSFGEWVARLNFSDGSYRLISSRGYNVHYNAQDERTASDHFGCDDAQWGKFLRKYIPEELLLPQ